MASSEISAVEVGIANNGFEANVEKPQSGDWSIECNITLEDIDASIHEIKANPIFLSGSFVSDDISVNIDKTPQTVMDIDVNVVVDGLNSSILESQVVPYERVIEISDLDHESTSEKRFASSALSSKKLHDLINLLSLKVDVIEGLINSKEEEEDKPSGDTQESYWKLDTRTGEIYTTMQVRVQNNLYATGEVSAGGKGSGTSGGGGGGSTFELLEKWIDYNAAIAQALGANLGVELHERVTAIENGSVTPDLSSYATKSYVSGEIKKVVGTAPENLDTLQEIASVLQNNINSIGDIIEAISYKADKTELTPLQTAISENLASINALRASYNSLLAHVNSEIARVEKAIGAVDTRVTTEAARLDKSVASVDSRVTTEVKKLEDADTAIKRDVAENKEDIAEVAELADGLREDVAYAKNAVDELKEVDKDLNSRLSKVEKMWKEDADGNIWTERNVYSLQEISAGGVGSGTSGGGGGGTGLGSIEGAVDTDITNPKDNDRLVYDKGIEKWVNKQVMVHKQVNTPAKVWNVEHGLGKIPNVKIVDSNGELVYGDVYHVDLNNVRIEFGGAFTGDVYLD